MRLCIVFSVVRSLNDENLCTNPTAEELAKFNSVIGLDDAFITANAHTHTRVVQTPVTFVDETTIYLNTFETEKG